MVDFLMISTRSTKRGSIEIYPKFIIQNPSSDLMIRGGDFYAIWLEEKGFWSTDEQDVIRLIDKELDLYLKNNRDRFGSDNVQVLHMWDAETGMIDRWHKFCQKQMRDSFHQLDEKLIFSNEEAKKTDYASHKLDYPLTDGTIEAYEELISTLYSEDERRKLEWAIGSIISGDSKKIQKFIVLYGDRGTGKSTILNIVEKLFKGYYTAFDAKALGSSNNAFALEAFKSNPLVAIQHDGDLSHIEDNTRLNSLVSHELMTVNEKFKSTYTNQFKTFLFMGTNKPVKITDSKSGLLRRLIDVSPTGNLVQQDRYDQLVGQIDFELGAIARHCLSVYQEYRNYYNHYIPVNMLGASNDLYNFVLESYSTFKSQEYVTLKQMWEMYNIYCEDAKVPYPMSQRVFREEMKTYFETFYERKYFGDGDRLRNVYYKFRFDRFDPDEDDKKTKKEQRHKTIIFEEQSSIFDRVCADCLAQLGTKSETPAKKWSEVSTTLKSIDTSKLHYVRVPKNHIVIDFDICDADGNKSFERNLEEASKWPPTYAELSKSGAGIHLHYIYNGDVSMLSRSYDENIEIKVFNGNSALRRKLTKCNNLPIAEINSGLPTKGEKVVNFENFKSEKGLRTLISRNLNKEIHPGTKPSVDFIYKILTEAYEGGLTYDVSDMKPAIIAFAAGSTHQADYCLKLINQMPFRSDDISDAEKDSNAEIVFYDVEVFPNLFLVCYKFAGEGKKVVQLFNPKPHEIEELLKYRLIGFNCRRYDNHLMYAAMMGYNNEQLYELSQSIISGNNKNCFFGEAYNLSYTDIYDFASAGNKKSLKKLEIEMGIYHLELGLPWDKPVDERLWKKVGEYCDNDVIATEAAFEYLKGDWVARQILADLAGGSVNDTTNSLTTKIIFGKNRAPQDQFHYRNLAEPVKSLDKDTKAFLKDIFPEMMAKKHGKEESLLPYWDGYVYESGKSTYRGEVVGEGGYVYAEPGIYYNVALLDVASMHPHSMLAECLFGAEFTRGLYEIVYGRVDIKHEDWEALNHILNGKLLPYVERVKKGELTSKQLANALKTAINSVYGLTAASFDNPFRDRRNIDNIVAKRGALFMIDLKHYVQDMGYQVVHIKTDSIKIANADSRVIDAVYEFGKTYGYSFEHEATYDRICLVNDAVYIAKYMDEGKWTATGTQFQVPYVFKTLFSNEPVDFRDMCETKSVSRGDIFLDMNEGYPDVSGYEKEWSDIQTKYRKGELSDTTFEAERARLIPEIEKGHNYVFIGRVGQFCPVIEGAGGGGLYRYSEGKYYTVTGTKGYRWLEAEMVHANSKENNIAISYYEKLQREAMDAISEYGDFDAFVSGVTPSDDFMNIPEWVEGDEMPFEKVA